MNDRDRLELYSYAGGTYEKFIGFVKKYIAHSMKMPFVEEDYYRLLWDAQFSHRKNIALISRGHSKSEVIAVWTTIYFAIFQPFNPFYERLHGAKKRVYDQLIFSSDGTTSTELFDRVKEYMRNDDVLASFLPDARDNTKNNNEKLELKNRSIIYCRSIKMKRGLHIDRAVGDDLTTESSTLSDQETWDFFTGAFLPMTNAKTAMIMIDGTPIRATDINSRLISNTEFDDWNKIRLPAILDFEAKTLLSPKRFTFEGLMNIKKDIGSPKFEAEYMLNPIDDTISLIKRDWVRQCFNHGVDMFRHRAFFDEVYLGVDFAFSDKITADYSVFCIIGASQNQFYLLDFVRKQGLSGMEQLSLIQELHSIYKFDLIGLEENSIQAVVKDYKNVRLPIKLFHTGNIDEKDKRNPDLSGVISVSKRNLVLRLATTFENKQIVLPYQGAEAKYKMDLLLEECVSWVLKEGKLDEVGRHPDIPVALGYALEVATKNTFVLDFAMTY